MEITSESQGTSLTCLSGIHEIRSQTSSASNYGFGETAILVRLYHLSKSCLTNHAHEMTPMALRPQIRIPTLYQVNFGVTSTIYERFVSKSQGPPTKLTKVSHTINIFALIHQIMSDLCENYFCIKITWSVSQNSMSHRKYKIVHCYASCFDIAKTSLKLSYFHK